MKSEPEVSILCITYNQSKYIRKTLEGFLDQETDFPFEIIIHDDASTDGTQEILREYEKRYPNIIKVIYEKENNFMNAALQGGYFRGLLESFASGKYIATCEGDDFWIEKKKLQVQYDFLESHPDYVCCGHAAVVVDESGKQNGKGYIGCGKVPVDLNVHMVLNDLLIQTATLFYRKGLSEDYVTNWFIPAPIGDIPWLIYLIEKGKVYYFPEVMSAYRSCSVGSYSAVSDHKVLFDRNLKLMRLCDSLNVKTGERYSKDFQERKINYACRAGIYGGLSFFVKKEEGKKIARCIPLKKWFGIVFYRIRSLLMSFCKNLIKILN